MKRDTDIIRDVLVWLLQDPSPPSSESLIAPESASSPVAPGADPCATINDPSDAMGWDDLDDLDVEADPLGLTDSNLGNSDRAYPVNRLGDIPAVQDRFQALLKRRLRLEIERRPPLFPWEQTNQDYPDWIAQDVAEPALWLQQLRQLNLPAQLPDEVLATLLNRCQATLQQSLQTGIRLIRAVEPLFPGQSNLDQMARLVLTSPARSAQEVPAIDYAAANPQQQVALTMMAAKSIFAALTLELTPAEPQVQRQWLTALGALTLEATYQPEANRIDLRSTLPEQGYLQVSDGTETRRTERHQPGTASLVLPAPTQGATYALEVALAGESPLRFLLSLATAGEA